MVKTLSDRLSEAARGNIRWDARREVRSLSDAMQASEARIRRGHSSTVRVESEIRALLRATVDPSQGFSPPRLDCRDIEPTGTGVLCASTHAAGRGCGRMDLESLSTRLSVDGRACHHADTYETFGLVDTWIRQVLLAPRARSVFVTLMRAATVEPRLVHGPGWPRTCFREIELAAAGASAIAQVPLLARSFRGAGAAHQRVHSWTSARARACRRGRARPPRPAHRAKRRFRTWSNSSRRCSFRDCHRARSRRWKPARRCGASPNRCSQRCSNRPRPARSSTPCEACRLSPPCTMGSSCMT
jgi:hypothetical protein